MCILKKKQNVNSKIAMAQNQQRKHKKRREETLYVLNSFPNYVNSFPSSYL